MNLTYSRVGDYYIPDLALPRASEIQIGKFGRLYLDYLKKHNSIRYNTLLLSGKLFGHLAEIDRNATEMYTRLAQQMAEAQSLTEELKAKNQMLWVQRMNNIRNAAEEAVLHNLIYV